MKAFVLTLMALIFDVLLVVMYSILAIVSKIWERKKTQ